MIVSEEELSRAIAVTAPLTPLICLPLLGRLESYLARGAFTNRRIEIVDPEQPEQRTLYEDVDTDDNNSSRRLCLVTLQPEYDRELALGGEPECYQELIDHAQALRDIVRALADGWVLASIVHDRKPHQDC